MTDSRARLPGTPDPTHVIAVSESLSISADSWGPESGRPVVLLHGGGQTRHAWRGAGQHLGDAGYYAIAIDLRGHGDSTWDEDGDYSNDAMVHDLVQVIERCGLEAPVLVGASLGGAVSLLAEGEGAVDASALVIVDTAPQIEAVGVANLRAFMTGRPEGFASLEEVADAISEYNPSRQRPATLDGLAKNVRVDDSGRYHWHWDPRFMSDAQPRPSGHWEQRQQRMEAAARRLSLPTLLVRGGLSDLLSEEGAAAFLQVCPHAEYVNITGASHMVAGDRNDRFAGAVIEFLGRVAPPDALS
jgi:pimeloyl-ACP methyl ester carboxylesterase